MHTLLLATQFSQRIAYSRFLSDLYRLLGANGIQPAPGYARCMTMPGDLVADGTARHIAVGRVIDYIDRHMDERLTLDRLAREAHLSKYHFARIFRDETGVPPATYVRDARLRRAKELLDADTDRTLADIALDTGFYDQSHFTRNFKQAEGRTPGRFREERKDVQDDEAGSA